MVTLGRKVGKLIRLAYPAADLATREVPGSLPRTKGTLGAFDLASEYWQVGLTEEAKKKTAFATSQVLYQFKVLPIGPCNAPSIFQRLMERALQSPR